MPDGSEPLRFFRRLLAERNLGLVPIAEPRLRWSLDRRRRWLQRGAAALVGKRFRVGPVECVGRRLAEQCGHLEKLARPGLLRPLVHRGGLRADILAGGTIAIDDEIA